VVVWCGKELDLKPNLSRPVPPCGTPARSSRCFRPGARNEAMTIERTDPPLEAAEREMLTAWLDWHRATLAHKCDGLSDAQLREQSSPPSQLSLLGLVRHMAEVDDPHDRGVRPTQRARRHGAGGHRRRHRRMTAPPVVGGPMPVRLGRGRCRMAAARSQISDRSVSEDNGSGPPDTSASTSRRATRVAETRRR